MLLMDVSPSCGLPRRPSAPFSPQHQTMPPLAMSHACMVPAEIERYLMTTTRVTVALLPSLVAVTVTVPRSTPVSMPVIGSIAATAGFDEVQRISRLPNTLPFASFRMRPIISELNASIVSRTGASTI